MLGITAVLGHSPLGMASLALTLSDIIRESGNTQHIIIACSAMTYDIFVEQLLMSLRSFAAL